MATTVSWFHGSSQKLLSRIRRRLRARRELRNAEPRARDKLLKKIGSSRALPIRDQDKETIDKMILLN